MKLKNPNRESPNFDIGTEYAIAEIVKVLRSVAPSFAFDLLDSMRRLSHRIPGYPATKESDGAVRPEETSNLSDSTPEGCADMILAKMKRYAPAWRAKVREALAQKLQAMTAKGQRKNREATK